MTDRELFEQALKALETNNQAWKNLADSGDAGFWEVEEQPFYETSVKAITALKAALAEPVQEPVAFIEAAIDNDCAYAYADGWNNCVRAHKGIATPQRKPLTEEEIRDLWSWAMTAEAERTATTQQHAFARAIERAHGIT